MPWNPQTVRKETDKDGETVRRIEKWHIIVFERRNTDGWSFLRERETSISDAISS
jgi:hypothetical protein